jgi:hypothetical protein
VRASVLAKVYYWYVVDEDFGPLCIKFGSYFPYPVNVCLNGHEFLLRQLAKAGVAHEALDNGLLACADAALAQRIAADRAAGYDYNLSIIQAEFALTQVFARPLTGRQFFEQIIKDNVTLGHPSQLQLIFDRKIMKTTPGRFRTRIITDGVIPSLHLHYKNTRIKQYHKLGRALRTETTINDTRDFQIGRALGNLAQPRKIGFGANRRLLGVQTAARDALHSEAAFRHVHEPLVTPQGQKIAGLRFGDLRVHQLLQALIVLSVLPGDFRARQLRAILGPSGQPPASAGLYTPGRTTYDLRRLRQHGLIARLPGTLAYRVTDLGLRAALFYTHAYDRVIAPGFTDFDLAIKAAPTDLRRALARLEQAWHRHSAPLFSQAA